MTAIPIGLGTLQSGISMGTIFNSVSGGSFVSGSPFSISILNGALGSYPVAADLWLVLGGSMTLSSSAPYIQAAIIPSDDGVNFEVAGVSNQQLFPYAGGVTVQLIPSQAYTSGAGNNTIRVPNIGYTAAVSGKLIVNWQGGVSFPSAVTATLYPYAWSVG